VESRCLLLLETPGAGMTADSTVSRDNPSRTGAHLRRFCDAAGLRREDMLVWNVVPWIVHAPGAANRPVRQQEIARGLSYLPTLLQLLPKLRVAVLAGRPARAAAPVIEAYRPDMPVLVMPHPSPTIVCTDPVIPERIIATLNEASCLTPVPAQAGTQGTTDHA
jgi:uracil-DNA glycosylase